MLNNLQNNRSDIFNLDVNDRVKSILLNMARWTKFLAIMGFIMMGIMIATFAVVSFNVPGNSIAYKAGYTFGILIFVLGIYFYPTYALLRFSSKIKMAFTSVNQEQFEIGLNNLKNSFKYIGILMIICIILYGVAIAVTVMDTMKLF